MKLKKPDGTIELTTTSTGCPPDKQGDVGCYTQGSAEWWRTTGRPWTFCWFSFEQARVIAIGSETVAEFIKQMEKK